MLDRWNDLIDRAKPLVLESPRLFDNLADAAQDLHDYPFHHKRILDDLERVIQSYEEDGPDEEED